jgi:tetratricopeptide (TPR) repeat protein
VGDLVMFKFGPRRGMRRGTSAIEWYERGRAAEEAGDLPGAIHAYERAIAGQPELADAHNNLGRLHHDASNDDASNLHDASKLHDASNQHDASNKPDASNLAAAESHYRLALCADRKVGLNWFNLGVVLEDQGRSAEAIEAYEHALALDAYLADAHFNLARQIEHAALRANDEVLMRRAVRHLKQYRELSRAG